MKYNHFNTTLSAWPILSRMLEMNGPKYIVSSLLFAILLVLNIIRDILMAQSITKCNSGMILRVQANNIILCN